MKKFTRVSLQKELCADADGMPVFRKCFDHEILLSFDDDSGAAAFEEWWNSAGAQNMYNWMKRHDVYKDECQYQ